MTLKANTGTGSRASTDIAPDFVDGEDKVIAAVEMVIGSVPLSESLGSVTSTVRARKV